MNGNDVSSNKGTVAGIKCGKKGYQLSKKEKGLSKVRCQNEGRTVDSPFGGDGKVNAEDEKQDAEHKEPPRLVMDQAKVITGVDLEEEFQKPTGPKVTGMAKTVRFLFLTFLFCLDIVNFEITIGGAAAGVIRIGLFGEVAPKTVENFAGLASRPEGNGYMGSIFHRVIPNFMIQGKF